MKNDFKQETLLSLTYYGDKLDVATEDNVIMLEFTTSRYDKKGKTIITSHIFDFDVDTPDGVEKFNEFVSKLSILKDQVNQ